MRTATNVLLTKTAQTGAVDGDWFEVPRPAFTHIPIAITKTAGTMTLKIYGRNGPNDDAVELDSVSDDDNISVQWCPQMRASLTAATAATCLVTAPIPCKRLVADS